jgi:hypothetical protein
MASDNRQEDKLLIVVNRAQTILSTPALLPHQMPNETDLMARVIQLKSLNTAIQIALGVEHD